MAYMDQSRKKVIAAGLKPILAKYGVKGSLSVRNHSTIVLTIREGNLTPFEDYIPRDNGKPFMLADRMYERDHINVNPYHYERHFDGQTLEFLRETFTVLNNGNHDRSDIMSDYFDVGWYVDVAFGKWDKPYRYNSVTKIG
tara:strand:+ start:2684 stop:3106 length:423 start_codon:yes stop_codon:yes gene_type:complete